MNELQQAPGGSGAAGRSGPGGERPSNPLSGLQSRLPGVRPLLASSGVLMIFIAMVLVFSILKPDRFPTIDNWRSILQQASIIAVLGAGLTVVLITKEFDLSFDSNAALSGAVAVQLMVGLSLPMGLGVIGAILTGALIGLVNGTIVAYARAPAFIATLAVGAVASGLQSWVTNEKTIFGVPDSYISISTTKIAGIPLYIILSLAVVGGIWFLLRKTVFGRHIYAVGSNPIAASAAGVRTARIRLFAFVVLGALAGVAGVMITAQAGGAAAANAAGLLLPTYTAAFLGASAFGGRFNAWGTYFGAVFAGALSTGLTMLQQPPFVAYLVTGAVLIVAVTLRPRT